MEGKMSTLTAKLFEDFTRILGSGNIVRYSLGRPKPDATYEEFYAEVIGVRKERGTFSIVRPRFTATLEKGKVRVVANIDNRLSTGRNPDSLRGAIVYILQRWENEENIGGRPRDAWIPRPRPDWLIGQQFVGIHSIGEQNKIVSATNLHMVPYHFLVAASIESLIMSELHRHNQIPESYQPLKLLGERFDAFLVNARMASARSLIEHS